MPKISIITPTQNRDNFLPATWHCVQDQTIRDIEWLVHDGSPQPSTTLNVGHGNSPRSLVKGLERFTSFEIES